MTERRKEDLWRWGNRNIVCLREKICMSMPALGVLTQNPGVLIIEMS